MANHHSFGGSRLPYLDDCLSFESKGGTSLAAEDGTEDHDIAEAVVTAFKFGHIELDEMIDWAYGNMIAIGYEEDRLEAVLWAVKRVVEVLRDTKVKREDIWLEEYVTIYEPSGNVVNFGSADMIIFFDRHDGKRCAMLIDYKFGRIKVKPAPMNLQGHSYAVATLQKVPELYSVTARFIQPRIYYDTEVTINRDDMADYYERIIEVIDGAQMFNPPRTPNKSCAYCKHAEEGSCDALANLTAIAAKGEDLPIPPTFEEGLLEHPQDVAKAFWCMKRIEALQKPLKQRMTSMLEQAGNISFVHGDHEVDFNIGYQRATREVADAAHVYEVLKDEFSQEQIMSCAKMVLSPLEEIYSNAKVAEYKQVVDQAKDQLATAKANKKKAKAEKDGPALAQADYWIDELTGKLRQLRDMRVTKKSAKDALENLLSSEGVITRSDAKIPRINMKIKSLNYNAIDIENHE